MATTVLVRARHAGARGESVDQAGSAVSDGMVGERLASSRNGILRCDVAVVGGGIVGLAVAFRLANDGASVVSVFPSAQSRSASRAAGAMLGACGESTLDEQERFGGLHLSQRLAAAARYPSWLEEIRSAGGEPPGLSLGTLILADRRRPRDLRNLGAIANAAQTAGQPFELGPDVAWGGDPENQASLLLPQEASIDMDGLIEGVRTALGNHHRHEVIADEAISLTIRSERVRGIVTGSGTRLEADVVVVAAGVASGPLLRQAGLDSSTQPIIGGKGVAALLRRRPSRTPADMVVRRTPNREFACGWHVVPRSAEIAYVGATNRVSSELSLSLDPTDDEREALDRGMSELDVRLSEAAVLEMRSAWRPVSPDGYPLVGLTDVEGLALATATYRNGVLLAPMIGDVIAREIAKAPSATPNVYSPRKETSRWTLSVEDALGVGLAHLEEMMDGPESAALGARKDVEAARRLLVAVHAGAPAPDRVSRFVWEHLAAYPLPEIVPEIVVLLCRKPTSGPSPRFSRSS